MNRILLVLMVCLTAGTNGYCQGHYITVNGATGDIPHLSLLNPGASGYTNDTRASIWLDNDGKLKLRSVTGNGIAFRNTQNTNDLLTITDSGIGIGMTQPTSKLNVAGHTYLSNPSNSNRYSTNDMLGNGCQLTVADPTNAVNNSTAAIQFTAFNAVAAIALDYTSTFYGDLMFGVNNGSYQVAEKMRITSGGNVGIGTTSPDAKLAVNGTIHSKEVKVDMNIFPDYVFSKRYILQPLKKVELYIKQNQHLPDVPSAKEVSMDGLNLGEGQAVLLKKVEELTLYLIEKDKMIAEQQKQLRLLQRQMKAIRESLAAIGVKHN